MKRSNYCNSLSRFLLPQEEYVKKANFFTPSTQKNVFEKSFFLIETPKYLLTDSSDTLLCPEKVTFYTKKLENVSFENFHEKRIKALNTDLQDMKERHDELLRSLSKAYNDKTDILVKIEVIQNEKQYKLNEDSVLIPTFRRSDRRKSTRKSKEEMVFLRKNSKDPSKDIQLVNSFVKIKESVCNRINQLREEIAQLESEIKVVKTEVEQIKQKLLFHYHNLLREGRDTRSEGLSWIIKAIWRLKKEVMPSFLPSFFDEELIQFCLSYAQDSLKLEGIKAEIEEFQKRNESMKSDAKRKRYMLANRDSLDKNSLFQTKLNDIIRLNNDDGKDKTFVDF